MENMMESRSYSEITNSDEENDPHIENEHTGKVDDENISIFDENQEDSTHNFQDETPLEIDDDITTLLNDIEKTDPAQHITGGIRLLMKKIVARYASKVEKKNRMILAKTVANPTISLKSIVDQVVAKKPSTASAQKEEVKDETNDTGADFMTVMLQKKMASMQKQVELAEQKSRSATLQWIADKAKYKEIVDQHKKEIEELTQKLTLLDRKLRLQEQLTRDPNMVKMENAIEEEINEIQQLRDSHAALEVEITEKRQMLAGLSTELSDAKIQLSANQVRLEYLADKVEELSRNEDAATTQIEKLTKDLEEKESRIYLLEEDNKELLKTLEHEKSNYWKLKESIEVSNQQYEQTIDRTRRQLEESQAALQKANEEREFLAIETTSKINRLNSENKRLILEKEQLLRDHGHLVKALQFTAKTSKSILQEFDRHEKEANKSIAEHQLQTVKMKNSITKLHENVVDVMEGSQQRLKEMEEKFASKQQLLLKSMEESNEAMKTLQTQLQERERSLLALEQEHTKAVNSLREAKSAMEQLEYELREERATEKGISSEEIERIKAEERTLWEQKLQEQDQQAQNQLKSLEGELRKKESLCEELQEQLERTEKVEIDCKLETKGGDMLDNMTQTDGDLENSSAELRTEELDSSEWTSGAGTEEINLGKIEKILRNALITNNYYFSKEKNGFTNSYPMDEGFLQDLIRSFHSYGKEILYLMGKAKETQPNLEDIAQDAERFLGMMSQDLLIKLEKSKEEIIVKVKNEAKDEMTEKVEATIKQLNEVKQSELFEQRESFQKDMLRRQQEYEQKMNELTSEMERMKDEYEEEIYIWQQRAATSSGNDKDELPPSESEDTGSLSVKEDGKDLLRNNSNSKRPTLMPGLSRRSTMRSSQRGMEREAVTVDSLSESERQKLEDQLREKLESEVRERLWTEVNSKHGFVQQVLDDDLNAMILDLMKDLPAKYRNMDLQQMRQELLSGDLSSIAIVQNENFDRLRNKNFGPDSLIALTILEHHARYDDGAPASENNESQSHNTRQSAISLGSNSGSINAGGSANEEQQQRQYRMQLKALEIKRKLLTQQIVGEVSVLDLYSFLHETEQQLFLLSSLNAWKSLLYYQTGGVFRDVLEVHRDVIKLCIKEAGGMTAAVTAVARLPPHSKTNHFPDPLRIKALEIFRLQLLQDSQRQNQSIVDLITTVAQTAEEPNKEFSKEREETMLRNLSPEQRKTFRQTRVSLQQEKLKTMVSVGTLAIAESEEEKSRDVSSLGSDATKGNSEAPLPSTVILPSKMVQEAGSRPDSGSSKSDSSFSLNPPPALIQVSRRRSEFIARPLDGKMRRSNTWKMKSERALSISSSKDNLLQIAEKTNLMQEKDAEEETDDQSLISSYSRQRTLHGRVDEIVFAALRGDEAERSLLLKLLDAFYNWEQNHNISANSLFQNCLGFSAEVDTVVSAMMKASLNSEIPLLMQEIYEKIRNLVNYYTFKDSIDPDDDQKQSEEQAKEQVKVTASGIAITNDTKVQRHRMRTMMKKDTYDCATQTTFGEELVVDTSLDSRAVQQGPTAIHRIPSGFRLALLQEEEFEIAPGIFLASIGRLIRTIKSQDLKLNKWKSMTAALARRQSHESSFRSETSASSIVNPSRFKPVDVLLEELAEIPDHIRYCFGPSITPFTHSTSEMATIQLPAPLQKAPQLLDLPIIEGCLAVVFPSTLPLGQGLNLITGFKYHEQGNDYLFTKLAVSEGKNSSNELITFPYDVLLLQIPDESELPRGLYPVELSDRIAYDASVFFTQRRVLETLQSSCVSSGEALLAKEWREIKLPPGHELVQVVNCCVDFPVGVEVSNGVKIAPVPSNVVLPANVKIVQKFRKTPLPNFLLPLKQVQSKPHEFSLSPSQLLISSGSNSEDMDGQSLPMQIRQNEGISIVAKPKSVHFLLGQELIRRPLGHPLPAGMKLVPKDSYPAGYQQTQDFELVQLTPKYDLPPTCRLNSSWYIYPRPEGVSLRPSQYLVFPDPSLEDHMIPPLPPFACPCPVPNLPYGVKLPNRTICVELLLSASAPFALPEGVILAPGITVLNPRNLHGWQVGISRCPINILLVKRSPGSVLPITVERGSRSDLPSGVLLGEGMDVVKLTTRFELPPGVKVDVGVTLGQYVQLAPGSQLLSAVVCSSLNHDSGSYLNSLTVVEWPYGASFPPGVELVKRPPPGTFLPFEYRQVVFPQSNSPTQSNSFKLPEDVILVKLPRAIKLATSLQLSEQITVGLESMVDYSRPLPEGMMFASRTTRHVLWPAEMRAVPHNALPTKLLQALEQANRDNMQTSDASDRGNLEGKDGPTKTKQRLNVEIVQLLPQHSLPSGVYLHEDVVTVSKPFYLHLPSNVVLVRINKPQSLAEILRELATRRIYEVEICPRHRLPLNVSKSQEKKDSSGDEASMVSSGMPVDSIWSLQSSDDCLVFLQLPDVFDVHSWGENLPGVEAVSCWRDGSQQISLPPGHFLIERPRQYQQVDLPNGFVLGIREEYKNLRIGSKAQSFSPQIEIMHILPSFHLPLGVNIINTSVIGKNSFNNNVGSTLLGLQGNSYTKKSFDPFWIPQFACFERVSRDAVILPWPRDLSKHLQRILSKIDGHLFYEPHAIIWQMKNVTKQEQQLLEMAHYPPNIVKHPRSHEIISELFKSQERIPAIQALLHFIRRSSVLGRFQQDSAAGNLSSDLKVQQVLQVVRISNGFPSLEERFEKVSLALKSSSLSKDPQEVAEPSPNLVVSSEEATAGTIASSDEEKDRKLLTSDHQRNGKITIYPRLSRIERIKVMSISEEIKRFLQDLLIFRFYSNQSKEELKEKLDYLQFDLMESSLWKTLSSNQELEKANERLAVNNDKLEKERQENLQLLHQQQRQLDEFRQMVNKEDDLKAIISKLKEQLSRKDQEMAELIEQQRLANQSLQNLSQFSQSQSTEEIHARYQQQVDLLTSQVASYEDKLQYFEQQKAIRDSDSAREAVSRGDFDTFRQRMENTLQNIILLVNSFIIQLIAQIDSRVFSQLSRDYRLVDLFQELFASRDNPIPSFPTVGEENSLDDNSSVITENSLLPKLAFHTQSNPQPPQVSPSGPQLASSNQSIVSSSSFSAAVSHDLTKDSRGKRLEISTDFPLDVKSMYQSRGQEKEFLSFSKPLLMSKSLDSLKAIPPKFSSNQGMDFAGLCRSVDLFLKAKQQKAQMFFNDSVLFNEGDDDDETQSSLGTVDHESPISSPVASPASRVGPSKRKSKASREQKKRRMKPAEINLLQWKSDVENHLLSINSLFQETVEKIIAENRRDSKPPKFSSSMVSDEEIRPKDQEEVGGRKSRRQHLLEKVAAAKVADEQVANAEVSWSHVEVSLQLMTEKVVAIFQSLLEKYQSNYHTLLRHVEMENQLLIKTIRQLRLHNSILKPGSSLLPSDEREDAVRGGEEYHNNLVQSLQQKVVTLEGKVSELLQRMIDSDSSPVEQSVKDFLEQHEIEKSLQFSILMIKQMIAREQQASAKLQSAEAGTSEEREKESKAVKQNIARLRHHVKDYEDRLQVIKSEQQSSSQAIFESIERFHRQIQSLLPPKLWSSLLHRGQVYYEKIQAVAAMSPRLSSTSNKPLLSPLPLSSTMNSAAVPISSNLSVSSASSSLAPELASLTSASTHRSKGQQSIIGSMPPAPSQSQFSNRLKHQNQQLAQVNKFFEHTYRKHKY